MKLIYQATSALFLSLATFAFGETGDIELCCAPNGGPCSLVPEDTCKYSGDITIHCDEVTGLCTYGRKTKSRSMDLSFELCCVPDGGPCSLVPPDTCKWNFYVNCDQVTGFCSYGPPKSESKARSGSKGNYIELCCQPNGGPCQLVEPGTCVSDNKPSYSDKIELCCAPNGGPCSLVPEDTCKYSGDDINIHCDEVTGLCTYGRKTKSRSASVPDFELCCVPDGGPCSLVPPDTCKWNFYVNCDPVTGFCSYDPPGGANYIELCCQPNGGPCELVKPGTCHSQIDLEL